MICNEPIIGSRLSLRTCVESDCNDEYLGWMTDTETNQYMETRWTTHSFDTIKEFINSMAASDNQFLFAIIENSTGRHIGNIKIGPINSRYHHADISYYIGAKDCRRKGYAKEAIALICDFGFNKLNLHRIQAGVIEGNEYSEKALIDTGFMLEAELRDRFIINGEYRNHKIYGLINNSN